jgi:hypothetical protein
LFGLIGLIDRGADSPAADEFAADVDVASVCRHRCACDQAAFDQEMRVGHDLAVLAGAGLGLVGINKVMRPITTCWA